MTMGKIMIQALKKLRDSTLTRIDVDGTDISLLWRGAEKLQLRDVRKLIEVTIPRLTAEVSWSPTDGQPTFDDDHAEYVLFTGKYWGLVGSEHTFGYVKDTYSRGLIIYARQGANEGAYVCVAVRCDDETAQHGCVIREVFGIKFLGRLETAAKVARGLTLLFNAY